MKASDPGFKAIEAWQHILCAMLNPACHYDLLEEDWIMLRAHAEKIKEELSAAIDFAELIKDE